MMPVMGAEMEKIIYCQVLTILTQDFVYPVEARLQRAVKVD